MKPRSVELIIETASVQRAHDVSDYLLKNNLATETEIYSLSDKLKTYVIAVCPKVAIKTLKADLKNKYEVFITSREIELR